MALRLALANLDRSLNNYEAAEPLYKRALTIREKALGPNHLAVADVLEHYAALLQLTKRTPQATELYTRAKAIRSRPAEETPKP